MEWEYWLWVYPGDAFLPFQDIAQGDKPGGRNDFKRTKRTTAFDEWVVKLIYEFMAAESVCCKCTSPLSSEIRVKRRWAGHRHSTAVKVYAKCTGDAQHQHLAVVTAGMSGLDLGRFHLAPLGRLPGISTTPVAY